MSEFDGPDYLITYPCFIFMETEDAPRIISVQGERCICLFTDSDLLFRFHASQPSRTIQVIAAQCDNNRTLKRVIEELEPTLSEENVERVAIDASAGRILTARLLDFVEMLDRQ